VEILKSLHQPSTIEPDNWSNAMAAKVTRKPAKQAAARKTGPKLLAGGNPQIAKGDGDAPVKAYIAAIPKGWKQDAARDLDALIVKTVPDVKKAMKWNSPFYGVEGRGWFLSFHCMTKYIKLAFFKGAALDPVPPEPSKDKNVRYFHINEGDALDAKLIAKWLKQAAKLPGWMA